LPLTRKKFRSLSSSPPRRYVEDRPSALGPAGGAAGAARRLQPGVGRSSGPLRPSEPLRRREGAYGWFARAFLLGRRRAGRRGGQWFPPRRPLGPLAEVGPRSSGPEAKNEGPKTIGAGLRGTDR
jgi:hypothetical protein